MGSYETSPNGFERECGFRKIDPAALTLGKTIKITTDGSCGGGGGLDRGVDGAVVWTANNESDWLVRVDTATGKVTTVSLKSALPAGYDMGSSPIAINGDAFVSLDPRYDQATRKQMTDANGKPLPPQIAKVDGATSKVTVEEGAAGLPPGVRRPVVRVPERRLAGRAVEVLRARSGDARVEGSQPGRHAVGRVGQGGRGRRRVVDDRPDRQQDLARRRSATPGKVDTRWPRARSTSACECGPDEPGRDRQGRLHRRWFVELRPGNEEEHRGLEDLQGVSHLSPVRTREMCPARSSFERRGRPVRELVVRPAVARGERFHGAGRGRARLGSGTRTTRRSSPSAPARRARPSVTPTATVFLGPGGPSISGVSSHDVSMRPVPDVESAGWVSPMRRYAVPARPGGSVARIRAVICGAR